MITGIMTAAQVSRTESLPHVRMALAMHPSDEYEQTVRRVSAKVR